MKPGIEHRTYDRLWRRLIRTAVIIAVSLVPGIMPPVLADTALTSLDAHGVTGRVTYNGPPAEPQFPPTEKRLRDTYIELRDPLNLSFCRQGAPSELVDGEFLVLKTIEVGAHKGLKGAIVAVIDILDERFMTEYPGTDVAIEHCRYSLFTGVVVKERSLRVENRDADRNNQKTVNGVGHWAHVVEMQVGTMFNLYLPEKGSRSDKPVRLKKEKEGSQVRLACDKHPWEEAFFLAVTNPYYARVLDDGSFVIKGVPPGRHRIVAWHPYAGRAEADIVVNQLGSAQVNFEFRKG